MISVKSGKGISRAAGAGASSGLPGRDRARRLGKIVMPNRTARACRSGLGQREKDEDGEERSHPGPISAGCLKILLSRVSRQTRKRSWRAPCVELQSRFARLWIFDAGAALSGAAGRLDLTMARGNGRDAAGLNAPATPARLSSASALLAHAIGASANGTPDERPGTFAARETAVTRNFTRARQVNLRA